MLLYSYLGLGILLRELLSVCLGIMLAHVQVALLDIGLLLLPQVHVPHLVLLHVLLAPYGRVCLRVLLVARSGQGLIHRVEAVKVCGNGVRKILTQSCCVRQPVDIWGCHHELHPRTGPHRCEKEVSKKRLCLRGLSEPSQTNAFKV